MIPEQGPLGPGLVGGTTPQTGINLPGFNNVPEEFRSGFANYLKENSNSSGNIFGFGGQAMSSVGLPGGGSVTFGDTGSAGAFRDYLKSIGVETPNSVPQLAIQQPLASGDGTKSEYYTGKDYGPKQGMPLTKQGMPLTQELKSQQLAAVYGDSPLASTVRTNMLSGGIARMLGE